MHDGGTFMVDNARRQWSEGTRRIDALRASRPDLGREADRAFAAIYDELTRRVGQVFTLEELAGAYQRAEDWAATEAHAAAPETPQAWELDTVLNAVFDRYARQAKDYAP